MNLYFFNLGVQSYQYGESKDPQRSVTLQSALEREKRNYNRNLDLATQEWLEGWYCAWSQEYLNKNMKVTMKR